MKKAFFVMTAVLFALAVVTCNVDSPIENDSNLVYDENGQPWGVNLTISAGAANRAMTDDLAKLLVSYYEVVFKNGSNYYRTRWSTGETGKLAVPFGNYGSVSGSDAAIMFAGRDSKTLLAVGNLVVGNINTSTASVTFSLVPLTTDVKAVATTTSFKITAGPTNPTSYYDGTPGKEFPTVTFNGTIHVPLFCVEADKSNTATYTIVGPANTFPHSAGVFVQTPELYSAAVDSQSSPGFKLANTSKIEWEDPDDAGVFISSGVMNSTGVFKFTLDVPDTVGMSRISYKIPVRAMNDPALSGDLWYLQGGIRNAEYDLGAGADSLGGSILLGIVDAGGTPTGWSNIEIGSPTLP